jgi:Zn-dependent protease with chaperone function
MLNEPRNPRLWHGAYFDGRDARRHAVTMMATSTGIDVYRGDDPPVQWLYDEIHLTQGTFRGEMVRLERSGDTTEVVVVDSPAFLDALRAAAPNWWARAASDRRRNWLVISVCAAAASVVVAWGVYRWGIPYLAEAVAARVPVEWEDQLGKAVADALAPAVDRCTDPTAVSAVTQIVGTLRHALPASRYSYKIAIVRMPVVNAFAAPGGHIVVTTEMLQRTRSPEELAGVLAHEIQHVEHRHGTKALLRQMSMRILIAAVVGDARGLNQTLTAAGTLGDLRYRRTDELSADRDGMRLQAARLDPAAMVTVFEILKEEGRRLPRLLTYVSTHPAIDERIRLLKKMAAESGYAPGKLLPGIAWTSVGAACK